MPDNAAPGLTITVQELADALRVWRETAGRENWPRRDDAEQDIDAASWLLRRIEWARAA